MSFLDKINPFGHGNKNPLDPSNAIRSIENAANKATQGAVSKIESEIQKELSKVEGELEDLIVQGLLALAGEAMKPGLALGAKVARKTDQLFDKMSGETKKEFAGAPFVLPITAGVVSIGFYWYGLWGGDRLHAIADDLDSYSHKGIGANRHDILQAVRDFGPDHVDIGVGVKFSLGVQFGVSPSIWSIPVKPFLEIADELLKEAGVP